MSGDHNMYAGGTVKDAAFTDIQKIIELTRKEERESCAKICDARAEQWLLEGITAYDTERSFEARACARDIRNRGEAKK